MRVVHYLRLRGAGGQLQSGFIMRRLSNSKSNGCAFGSHYCAITEATVTRDRLGSFICFELSFAARPHLTRHFPNPARDSTKSANGTSGRGPNSRSQERPLYKL